LLSMMRSADGTSGAASNVATDDAVFRTF
jgi:hypothetical protein